ncbi:ScyD/ScyE family protein [Rubellimicrobium arenae]|uniref:ScyD/ScyE family protein n=1 Tax=Rubellimicrobium arenae TaxID=2817372 RepID=UPI001B3049DB|nr:ScyD/ScyE family protein [Rubellimicrobium arenae]
MHTTSMLPLSRVLGNRRRLGLSALALTAGLMAPVVAQAATLTFAGTVMSNLATPRGLTIGADGALYVAEAGSGGDLATIEGPDGAVLGYGLSGGVSRYKDGTQERIITDLPSLSGPGGAGAVGAQDVALGADGTLHAVIGLGADPAVRQGALAGLEGADLLGTLVSLRDGAPTHVADIAGFEGENDPDGVGPDSNPFSLVANGDGFLVTDAGGNDVLSVDGTGTIGMEAVLPAAVNPLPFGPPVYQAVPTGAAISPTGELVFGQLTGFPFPEDAAQIYSLKGGTLSIIAGGFTNLIDVAYGSDGTLYALELDSDSLLNPGTTGALYSIAADGTSKLLFGDLSNPTGLAVGDRGRVYVAINGFSAEDGSVIELAPIPLPASLPLLAGGLLVLGGWRRVARSRSGRA